MYSVIFVMVDLASVLSLELVMERFFISLCLSPSADTSQEEQATSLHKRAKVIANSVQSICIRERPTVQPKRLVVSTVIHQILTSLIDTVLPVRMFFTEELPQQDHLGLKYACVCLVK